MGEHQAGRVIEAEAAYRGLLADYPDDVNVAHYLGMLRFQVGEVDEGFTLVRRSLESDPANPHYWNNLGNMYVQTQRDQDAEQAYLRATALDPRSEAAWYNLGRIYIRKRQFERAIEAVRNVTRLRTGSSFALHTLANLYYRLGRLQAAREVYEQWAAEAPEDPTPRHMLAAVSGREVPDRADDRYIVKTFDEFADNFDQKLAQLDYSAPALAAANLIEHPLYQTGRALILDAGCGTGWCGPLLRSTAARLVGVDLSPGMLAQARRRAVYDELHEGELTAFMASHREAFDIIVSTDVLCYFGRLDAALRAAHDALKAGGLLCFTVEALADAAAAGECFRLGEHGRYGHDPRYLGRVVADAGFEAPRIEAVVLRQELGRPVPGYLVIGRRCALGAGARSEAR